MATQFIDVADNKRLGGQSYLGTIVWIVLFTIQNIFLSLSFFYVVLALILLGVCNLLFREGLRESLLKLKANSTQPILTPNHEDPELLDLSQLKAIEPLKRKYHVN